MRRATTSILAIALLAPAVLAQGADRLEGFQLTGDFILQIDGTPDAAAEVYFSDTARAYLAISPALPAPVLIQPGAQTVETINLLKLHERGDGGLDLLPDPVLASQGRFQVSGEGVAFTVDGVAAELTRKPPLLGRQATEDLREYSLDYARLADTYTPSAPVLGELRAEGREVLLQVYFGSWCPFCQQMIPRVMRVAEELRGSKIGIDFYGLPRDFKSDSAASRLDITGVPTGILYVDGREAGRIQGQSWRVPELALRDTLNDS